MSSKRDADSRLRMRKRSFDGRRQVRFQNADCERQEPSRLSDRSQISDLRFQISDWWWDSQFHTRMQIVDWRNEHRGRVEKSEGRVRADSRMQNVWRWLAVQKPTTEIF